MLGHINITVISCMFTKYTAKVGEKVGGEGGGGGSGGLEKGGGGGYSGGRGEAQSVFDR